MNNFQLGDTSKIVCNNAEIDDSVVIGNNVQIAGGSGVIKDIDDNTKVMGYPPKDLKNFIRENK